MPCSRLGTIILGGKAHIAPRGVIATPNLGETGSSFSSVRGSILPAFVSGNRNITNQTGRLLYRLIYVSAQIFLLFLSPCKKMGLELTSCSYSAFLRCSPRLLVFPICADLNARLAGLAEKKLTPASPAA
jgi:hypothetical protein